MNEHADIQDTFAQHNMTIQKCDICTICADYKMSNVACSCSEIRLIYFSYHIHISMTEHHLSFSVVANVYLHLSKTADSPRGNAISGVGAD